MAHAHDIEGQVTYITFSFYQVVAKGNAFLSAMTDPHLCDNPVKYLRFKGGQATSLTQVVDPGEILPPGQLSTPSTYRKCCTYTVLSNNPYLYDSQVYDLRFKVRCLLRVVFF